MTARHITRLVPVLLVAVLALAPFASAWAVEPTRETVTLTRDFGVVGSCDGFDVTAMFYVTRTVTTFYDRDGNAVRRIVHAEIPGTVTNAVTGKTLESKGVRNIFFDLTDGTVRDTGTNTHVVVPGYGTVMLGVRGDPPVTPELCEALS